MPLVQVSAVEVCAKAELNRVRAFVPLKHHFLVRLVAGQQAVTTIEQCAIRPKRYGLLQAALFDVSAKILELITLDHRETVAQLRRLARVAGLPRSLTRSGRRADLLLALNGLEVGASS